MIDDQSYIPIVHCEWDLGESFTISIFFESDLDDKRFGFHRYGAFSVSEGQDEELRQERFSIGRFDIEHMLDGFGLFVDEGVGFTRIT